MSEETAYLKILKETQEISCTNIENLFFEHLKNLYEKYNNWGKYPRKIKKLLKKRGFWCLRNMKPIKPNVQMKR